MDFNVVYLHCIKMENFSDNYMYTRNLKLKDHEIPAKINLETGEITKVRNMFNSFPEGKELWLKDEKFSKTFTYSWKFLAKNLSSDEIKVLVVMTLLAQPGTNSMPPLNEEVSMLQMEEYFGVSRKSYLRYLKIYLMLVFLQSLRLQL